MRKVELNMKELQKYEKIKEFVDHGGNKNRIALQLNISRRQVNRLIIKYNEKGKSAFIHGNCTKKPVNALDKSIPEDIILLYKNKYYDFFINCRIESHKYFNIEIFVTFYVDIYKSRQ